MPKATLPTLFVGNFKAFSDIQALPLRPLTLVYGPNSAGKSSLLHSQLLLRYASAHNSLDVTSFRDEHQHVRLRTAGVSTLDTQGLSPVDIGKFTSYIHHRDRTLALAIRWHRSVLSRPTARWLGEFRYVTLGLSLDQDFFTDQNSDGSYEDVEQINATLDLKLDDTSLVSGSIWSAPPDLTERLGGFVARTRTRAMHKRRTLLMAGNDLRVHPHQLTAWPPQRIRFAHVRGDDLLLTETTPPPNSFESRFHGLLRELAELLQQHLDRLIYLGPLRGIPERSRLHTPSMAPSETAAWQQLVNDSRTRAQVNSWLTSPGRLHTPYLFWIKRQGPGIPIADKHRRRFARALQPIAQHVLADYRRTVAKEINVAFPELAAYTPQSIVEFWLGSLPVVSEAPLSDDLVLVDVRAKKALSLHDVGIGLSQLLPILVMAYGSSSRLIAVEQPELHLHPALQADVADVLIESALGRNRNTWLVETHSEHLLLRIMRRIRESRRTSASRSLPRIGPDDVQVLYVERVGDRSVVREMPLGREGELLKPWPGGFFEEGFREVFG